MRFVLTLFMQVYRPSIQPRDIIAFADYENLSVLPTSVGDNFQENVFQHRSGVKLYAVAAVVLVLSGCKRGTMQSVVVAEDECRVSALVVIGIHQLR